MNLSHTPIRPYTHPLHSTVICYLLSIQTSFATTTARSLLEARSRPRPSPHQPPSPSPHTSNPNPLFPYLPSLQNSLLSLVLVTAMPTVFILANPPPPNKPTTPPTTTPSTAPHPSEATDTTAPAPRASTLLPPPSPSAPNSPI